MNTGGYQAGRHIGEILKDRTIILRGADPVTQQGFVQVPTMIITAKNISANAKLTYAMLLKYAWDNGFCFPGQDRLAADLGLSRQRANIYIQELAQKGYINIVRRGQGKTNIYEVNFKVARKAK
jgi:biotin operon repressor